MRFLDRHRRTALMLAGVLLAGGAVAWAVWGGSTVALATTVAAGLLGVSAQLSAMLPRPSAADLTAEAMADQIAVAARRRWEVEAELRRVNDPYTIPVRWEPAGPDLVDDWAVLEHAASSAGWPDTDRSRWAAAPSDMAGRGGDIAGVLEKVPTRRLVVLGEPGAGKTVLAVRLVLDLLARRRAGGQVPVLVPLASWHPSREHLREWCTRRLWLDYPALRNPAPGHGGVTWARALWDAGLLLPVLDGLDEIDEAARGEALAGLNEAVRPGVGVVLTARTDPYRALVNPQGDGAGAWLSGAAAIRLCPLDPDTVAGYLRAASAGPGGRARWERVLTALADPGHPVARAFASPLMVVLARTVYGPRPGGYTEGVPHPDELVDGRLASREDVERHLLSGFVAAAYRSHPDRPGEWDPVRAHGWLAFLARYLERRGTTDLAWWELRSATPRGAAGLVFGLGAGLPAALVGAVVAAATGGIVLRVTIIYGLLVAAAMAMATWQRGPDRPARGLRWSPNWRFGVTALCGLAVAGVLGALGVPFFDPFSPQTAMNLVLLVLTFSVALGFSRRLDAPSIIGDPETALRHDRAACRVSGLVAGLVFGLLTFVGFGVLIDERPQNASDVAILMTMVVAVALPFGTGVGLHQTAWGWFAAARCWLALRGRLPWRLMRFLADAHRRGVLRQAGAVYQFRHVELQRHLAGRR